MPTHFRRATAMLAFTLVSSSVSACGGAPSTQVQTGPGPTDTGPDHAETDARAALEALREIPDTRVCVTPELCEDLREWRPDRLEVLDGHLVAMGGEHAFIRVNGAWAHHAIPLHGEPMSNGHAAFFCDHEGGVFELTTEGLRRRGTLPAPACAAVVAAGSQLYVVVGDGPILRQDGNAWAALEIELPYGNGYSVDTVVMTPTRAFLVDREARLLELPSAGPSYEPRVAVETGLGHMTTLRGVPGREAIVALGREIAILEDGSVRQVPLPGREPRPTSPEPSADNDGDSEHGEEDEYEDEELEEESADGMRQISDTEFEMGMWVVGLEPLIVARGHVVMTPGTPRGELTLDHYVLGPSGWSAMTPRSPESFLFAVGSGAFDTTLPDRTSPVHLGPYRVVVNAYRHGARGPIVTAWRHDGVDVELTAFAPEETNAALEARCEGEGVRCGFVRGGSIARLVSGPPPTLEILRADRAEVLQRHQGPQVLPRPPVVGR